MALKSRRTWDQLPTLCLYQDRCWSLMHESRWSGLSLIETHLKLAANSAQGQLLTIKESCSTISPASNALANFSQRRLCWCAKMGFQNEDQWPSWWHSAWYCTCVYIGRAIQIQVPGRMPNRGSTASNAVTSVPCQRKIEQGASCLFLLSHPVTKAGHVTQRNKSRRRNERGS
jgi:hypothetical protein